MDDPRTSIAGYFVEPTVFANVDNSSTIAQEEIFGPVLSASSRPTTRANSVSIANDTIYGLNASVFTNDVDRAREIAGQLRSGTVGHNAFRTDFSIAFGGFKQSGIGREGGTEGLLPFLETKTVILEGVHPGTTSERKQPQLKRNQLTVEGGTAIFALAGDKVNALDREVLEEITVFVEYCETDSGDHLVGADRGRQVLLGRSQRE